MLRKLFRFKEKGSFKGNASKTKCFFRICVMSVLAGFLTGCAVSIEDYQASQPAFKLEEFFEGKLIAWGTFQDRSGKVTRRFKVDMEGSWQGSKGVLDEDFIYDDGEKQKRIWYLEKLSEGRYRGTASDVVGEAIGEVEGFALNWSYDLLLPVDDTEYQLTFNDWMYLLDERSVINKASVTKFGIEVGQVTLFIQKQ
ncbi:DUF3833 domain-containing protein [Pleionea litopenaei]|uniref:DUF3833 domain-containing protein n=1 Tax=Pleionea litopenaei TaxID=3070815 RepID=A0AA51RV88_9GAMM|nr:DUF3833 domain-containing protein [Pleionea sp. HL-JVS1]WMS88232.1 DUF3833 domain-containing protein [Pleionea sp. HL-JVS1]